MKFYSYDQLTLAYLGNSGDAPECPVHCNEHHLPAWATFKEPPVEEGKTAYWNEEADAWELRDTPAEEVAAEIVGLEAPVVDKAKVLRDMTAWNIDQMAVAMGFRDALDVLSYLGEESQRGYDATAFRAWRTSINETLDALIAKYAQPDVAFVQSFEYAAAFNAIRLERKMFAAEPTEEPDA